MSSVDVAMARSLRDGALQQVKRSLLTRAPDLASRDFLIDAADKVVDVKAAFSSWDNCMKANFCKWPVIAVIVVGSLLLFSIVWCLVRRIFCGLACCCACFQCLKCCGNCCGCCDAPGKRKHKYLDEPYIPPHHGYQAHGPMNAAGALKPEPPQYAEFDVSRKGGDDALPAMPSWESGSSKKVLVEDDEVEMSHLNKTSASSNPHSALPSTPSAAMGTDAFSPHGPPSGSLAGYMPGHGQQAGGGAYGRLAAAHSQYSAGGRGYQDYGANQGPDGFPFDQPAAGYARAQTPRAHHPTQDYSDLRSEPSQFGQYEPPGLTGSPAPGYGPRRQGTGDGAAMAGGRPPYGMDPRARGSPGPRQTPGPQGDYQYMPPRASPAPREQDYATPDYGHQGYGHQGYGPASEYDSRPYSPAHRPPPAAWPSQHQQPLGDSAPQSPITNNSGFDFTSGYARPPTSDRRSDPDRSPTHEPYPGYKAYQPA
ncbi:hypothetical protein CDD83_1786 [Cordyceps sp. RAO-2017]|nr:hypothetical protein CDD83_1786 [Cordyceps sp. RAO-2017]